ncbi:MAG: TetR/AcrR family transcriptional regulator [Gammaproteobacteria bacterium]|nr:TetR/AcrR family transcriptional regulator [Gammaproteobacteria bacterium]MYE81784.1 TetR/AcrR family transcriptional regulator [Gammaproteobacteria bacterium]
MAAMGESEAAAPGRGSALDDRGLRTVSRLRPEDWLNAAQRRLVHGGIDAVKIGPLAEDLTVTRGSFYWHFRDRNHLLETLLSQWRGQSREMFERLVGGDGASGMEEFVRLVHLWVDESEFDPSLESAMRDWARTSDDVSAVVKTVDEERIAYIKRIFLDFGYGEDEAFIRARITYFHQVGYYTIGYNESLDARMALLPMYVYVLTGKFAPEEIAEYF